MLEEDLTSPHLTHQLGLTGDPSSVSASMPFACRRRLSARTAAAAAPSWWHQAWSCLRSQQSTGYRTQRHHLNLQ